MRLVSMENIDQDWIDPEAVVAIWKNGGAGTKAIMSSGNTICINDVSPSRVAELINEALEPF